MINAQSAAPFAPSTAPNVNSTPSMPPGEQVFIPPSNDSIPPTNNSKKGISKNVKLALGLALLLITVVGSGVGYLLMQQQQDIRQQADEVKPTTSPPIVRPPETTSPTVTTQCVKTAYVDPGPNLDYSATRLTQTDTYNSTQPILFKVEVKAGQQGNILIRDYLTPFLKAGYLLKTVQTVPAGVCTSSDLASDPYTCNWAATSADQTLTLFFRLEPTITFFGDPASVIEPEKITVRNLVTLVGGGTGRRDSNEENIIDPSSDEDPSAPSCEVSVKIPGTTGVIPTPAATPTLDISCTNTTYENAASNTAGNYSVTPLTQKSTFKPGEMVVYQVSVRNNTINPVVVTLPITDNTAKSYLSFVDSTCGATAYNSSTNTLTCPALDFTSGNSSEADTAFKTKTHLVRMKIADNTPTTKIPITASIQPAVIPNSDSYIRTCDASIAVEAGSTTVTPTPSATPAIGCNQACNTNSDCSNPNHICTTVDNSKVCRLASNTSSSSCTAQTSSTSSTPQPSLPPELPQTGAFDAPTWMKAGLGALGVGLMILLFL